MKTPLVQSVLIVGVDRDDPQVQRWVDRFAGHAVTPEKAADQILSGVAKNRCLIYTSQDIRALYFTGGSTGLKLLTDQLEAAFPGARAVRGDRLASVATGLGLHAARLYGA